MLKLEEPIFLSKKYCGFILQNSFHFASGNYAFSAEQVSYIIVYISLIIILIETEIPKQKAQMPFGWWACLDLIVFAPYLAMFLIKNTCEPIYYTF